MFQKYPLISKFKPGLIGEARGIEKDLPAKELYGL